MTESEEFVLKNTALIEKYLENKAGPTNNAALFSGKR
jgi:hypothetical protein